MNYSDTVSNMIVNILNAQKIKLEYIFICFSKINFFILNVLKNEGYINNFYKVNDNFRSYLMIFIKYFHKKPVIQFFKRISKPGLRIYKKKKFIPRIMNGLGICIISTNKGVITDKIARKLRIGGEIICYVF